ncbi:MAG TPA: AAA family ATPase [Streptosporangiaceae bacterium]
MVDGRLGYSSEPVMPPVSEQRLYLVAAAGLEVFRPVFDGLAGITVFNLSGSTDKTRIEEYLQLIVPGMRGVRRSDLGNWETLREPESALHPAAAGVLLDALRDASERRQVIVTSHSPDLLDRHDFKLSELRAVRSINGETVIGELDQAGALALRESASGLSSLIKSPSELTEVRVIIEASQQEVVVSPDD